MKLFTKPRPLQTWQLRTGDMLALKADGSRIPDEPLFLDVDLADMVRWVVIHAVNRGRQDRWTVHHSEGTMTGHHMDDGWMAREYVDIDPWSYVTSR